MIYTSYQVTFYIDNEELSDMMTTKSRDIKVRFSMTATSSIQHGAFSPITNQALVVDAPSP